MQYKLAPLQNTNCCAAVSLVRRRSAAERRSLAHLTARSNPSLARALAPAQNTDCAAAMLLMRRAEAEKRGLPILGVLRRQAGRGRQRRAGRLGRSCGGAAGKRLLNQPWQPVCPASAAWLRWLAYLVSALSAPCLPPIARSFATVGVPPGVMGTAPTLAIPKVCALGRSMLSGRLHPTVPRWIVCVYRAALPRLGPFQCARSAMRLLLLVRRSPAQALERAGLRKEDVEVFELKCAAAAAAASAAAAPLLLLLQQPRPPRPPPPPPPPCCCCCC